MQPTTDEPGRYNLRSGNRPSNQHSTTPPRGNHRPNGPFQRHSMSARPAALDWDVLGDTTDSSADEPETSSSSASRSTDLADKENCEREFANRGSFRRFLKAIFFMYVSFAVFVNLTWLVPDNDGTAYRVEVATLDIFSGVLNLTEKFSPMLFVLVNTIGPPQLQHRMNNSTGYKCAETGVSPENEKGEGVCSSGSERTCRSKRGPVPDYCVQGLPLDPMTSLYRLKSVIYPLYQGINIPCRILLKLDSRRAPLSVEHHAYLTNMCSHADKLYKTVDRDIHAVTGAFFPLWRHLKQRLAFTEEILIPPKNYLGSLGSQETLGTGFHPPAYLNPVTRPHRKIPSTDIVFESRWLCSLRAQRWWPGAPCHFGEVLGRTYPPSKASREFLHELERVVVWAPWLPYCDAHPSELPGMNRQPGPPPLPLWNPLRRMEHKASNGILNQFVTDLTKLDDALGELIQLPRSILNHGVLKTTWWKPWGRYWDDRGGILLHYFKRTDLLATHATYLRTTVQSLLDAFSEALATNRQICASSEAILERLSLLISGRSWWSVSMEKDGLSPGKVQMVLEYGAMPPPDEALEEMRETLDRIAETHASIGSHWNEWSATRGSQIQEGAWNMANCEEMIKTADIHWYYSCKVFLEKWRRHMESHGPA